MNILDVVMQIADIRHKINISFPDTYQSVMRNRFRNYSGPMFILWDRFLWHREYASDRMHATLVLMSQKIVP